MAGRGSPVPRIVTATRSRRPPPAHSHASTPDCIPSSTPPDRAPQFYKRSPIPTIDVKARKNREILRAFLVFRGSMLTGRLPPGRMRSRLNVGFVVRIQLGVERSWSRAVSRWATIGAVIALASPSSIMPLIACTAVRRILRSSSAITPAGTYYYKDEGRGVQWQCIDQLMVSREIAVAWKTSWNPRMLLVSGLLRATGPPAAA